MNSRNERPFSIRCLKHSARSIAFTLNFEDKAGNVSEQYGEVSFTVDKTRPELEISGVEDASANKGQVIPVITYSDVNADADSFEFKLYDSAGNEVTSFVDENGNAASVDSMLSTYLDGGEDIYE